MNLEGPRQPNGVIPCAQIMASQKGSNDHIVVGLIKDFLTEDLMNVKIIAAHSLK